MMMPNVITEYNHYCESCACNNVNMWYIREIFSFYVCLCVYLWNIDIDLQTFYVCKCLDFSKSIRRHSRLSFISFIQNPFIHTTYLCLHRIIISELHFFLFCFDILLIKISHSFSLYPDWNRLVAATTTTTKGTKKKRIHDNQDINTHAEYSMKSPNCCCCCSILNQKFFFVLLTILFVCLIWFFSCIFFSGHNISLCLKTTKKK